MLGVAELVTRAEPRVTHNIRQLQEVSIDRVSVQNGAWCAHGFNYKYWQNGWGYDDCCNIRKPLAPALNAIWLLNYSAERQRGLGQ